MKKILRHILFLVLTVSLFSARGQVNIRDSVVNFPIVYAAYGFHFLGGDIAESFGPSSTIGGGIGYKTGKNFYFGLEYSYLFGGKVKNGDEILQDLLTHDGQLIGQDGEYAIFQYMQRGHIIWFQAGKLIPVLSKNPNSGILIKLGGGFVQHRMDIAVRENTALQLSDDYKYGYDRLTRGFGLNQFIGYLFVGESKLLNFYAGLDFSQAWTKNVRDVNFDTRLSDDSRHLDLFFGFKVGWVIPIYRSAPVDYYY